MALIEFQRRGGTLRLRCLLCWDRNSSESKMLTTCTGKILVPVLYITLTTHMQQLYKHWDSVPRFSSCNSLNTLRDQIRVFTLSTPNNVLRLNPNILPWCWVGYCGKTIPGGRRFLYKKSRHALLFMSFVCVGSSTPVILQISNFKIISSLTYTNNFLVFSTQQTKAVT